MDDYYELTPEIKECLKELNPEEYCWKTNKYLSNCNCEKCEHKYDCSGYEGDDEYERYDEDDND